MTYGDETISLGNIARGSKEVLITTDKFTNEGHFVSGISPLNREMASFQYSMYIVDDTIAVLLLREL